MAEQPTFESVNGVYRITEEQKPQLKEFFINEMEKHPKTAKGWLSKSKVNTKTIITDSKGNDLYEAFFKGNQDKWKFNKLETQIKSSNKRKVNEAALDTKKAKAWKKKNITDWNLKDNPTGKPITDSHPEFRRFEHRIKVSDNFWKSNDALDLGFKAGDVENLTYTNPAQWKLKDAGEMRYGQYFNFDVDDFGQVTYTPRSKFHPFELNDTKAFKGKIPLKELAEEAGHAYQRFGINPKRALFSTLKNPAVKTAASLGALSLLGSGLELKAAVDEQENPNNSLLQQKAADLKLISEALAIQSIGLPSAFPISLAAKVAELHLRNRDKFEKNRYQTWRSLPSHSNLEIKQTPADAAVRSLELK